MGCNQADKKISLYACQAELRQEGRLETEVRGLCAHVTSGFGSRILQGSNQRTPQPYSEVVAPALFSLLPRPAVKACELFKRLSSLWCIGEGGRVPSLPVGNSILPTEAVGNHGPWC